MFHSLVLKSTPILLYLDEKQRNHPRLSIPNVKDIRIEDLLEIHPLDLESLVKGPEIMEELENVKQEIRKAESKIEKNLSKPIFSDDVDVIMKNDDKYIEVVKRQLEFEHFDQKSAKTHIEKKLQNMESSLTTKRFRRRYIKTIN